MPNYGEEITNDDIIDFINTNLQMNRGMKTVSRFMTNGSWENATVEKRKQMLQFFLTSKARQLAGINFSSLLPDLQHKYVQDVIDFTARNINDGKDALILFTDQEMDVIAFPSFSPDVASSYADESTEEKVEEMYNTQKAMLQQVANGDPASYVLGLHAQELGIDESADNNVDILDMDNIGTNGLRQFLYNEEPEEEPKSAAEYLYGSDGLSEDNGQEQVKEEPHDILNEDSEDEIVLTYNNVNLNDLYVDQNDQAPENVQPEEPKQQVQKNVEEEKQ